MTTPIVFAATGAEISRVSLIGHQRVASCRQSEIWLWQPDKQYIAQPSQFSHIAVIEA